MREWQPGDKVSACVMYYLYQSRWYNCTIVQKRNDYLYTVVVDKYGTEREVTDNVIRPRKVTR